MEAAGLQGARMNQLLDIVGSSGASYRFRRHQESDELPATAGNVLYARQCGATWTLVCCAEIDSLLKTYGGWTEARGVHDATDVYLRLNVSRATRLQEHVDIVEKHDPPMRGF